MIYLRKKESGSRDITLRISFPRPLCSLVFAHLFPSSNYAFLPPLPQLYPRVIRIITIKLVVSFLRFNLLHHSCRAKLRSAFEENQESPERKKKEETEERERGRREGERVLLLPLTVRDIFFIPFVHFSAEISS